MLSSGTWFKYQDFIITNNHVIQVSEATHVLVSFVGEDCVTVKTSRRFEIHEFQQKLIAGDDEKGWDYAIIDAKNEEFVDIPSLKLSSDNSFPIGKPIVILGFQFNKTNLSMHTGIISSKYVKAGVNYLQLDASVNQGNSGGPLIDPSSLEVIGIVTRKETGLTKLFHEQLNGIATYQEMMGDMLYLVGDTPTKAIIEAQHMVKILSKAILRSANVGVGYAYQLNGINKILPYIT